MKHRILYNGLIFGLVGAMLLAGLPPKAKAASAGALDFTFSGDGKLITNISGDDSATDVAIQPDGKIIVVGRTEPVVDEGDFAIVRYNPDGSLDTTFDTDGIVTTNFGASENANAVALQVDGKIVVAGSSGEDFEGTDFAAARYHPNGSLDTGFDGDGRILTDFAGSRDTARGIIIQPDGKIILGGTASIPVGGDNDNFALARYNLNGTLDTTFSTDGRANFDHLGSSDSCEDIELQLDGKIVAVGRVFGDFGIFRINPNGSADATFDTDGLVVTDISGSDSATSVEIQPDGKIIVAGSSDGLQNASMARYNSDGSLDNSFDGDGKVLLNLNPSFQDRIQDIKLRGDGKILAGLRSTGDTFLGINAVRFNANGSQDLSFGNNGRATTAVQTSNITAAIAIYGSDLIVVGDGQDFNVARFTLDIQPTQSNDFDGDGFSDYAIFRPSNSAWFILQSLTSTVRITGFGSNGDVPLDGDFDGDGLNDLAIYRPGAGQWWFQRSSDLSVFAAQFGEAGDKPVPGDVDKDGKTDFVLWRPSNANYFVVRSSDNFATFFGFPFGANGDVPVGTAIFP